MRRNKYALYPLRQGLTTGEVWRKSEECSERGHEVGRLHRTIDEHIFPNPCASHHHPRGSRKRIAGAVMLKAIPAGRCIRIAAEVGENEHGCLAGIFGLALNHLPNLGAEPIGTLYRIHVERISAGMRDINIMQSYPEQTRGELMHQLPGNVDRKFVWAAQTASVGGEIRNGELQHLRHLLQLLITYAQRRRIDRALIVVAQ